MGELKAENQKLTRSKKKIQEEVREREREEGGGREGGEERELHVRSITPLVLLSLCTYMYVHVFSIHISIHVLYSVYSHPYVHVHYSWMILPSQMSLNANK